MRLGHVVEDFCNDALLSAGQIERQPRPEAFDLLAARTQRQSRLGPSELTQASETHVVSQQFLESEPPLTRMPALEHAFDIGVSGRPMQVVDCFRKRR